MTLKMCSVCYLISLVFDTFGDSLNVRNMSEETQLIVY